MPKLKRHFQPGKCTSTVNSQIKTVAEAVVVVVVAFASSADLH